MLATVWAHIDTEQSKHLAGRSGFRQKYYNNSSGERLLQPAVPGDQRGMWILTVYMWSWTNHAGIFSALSEQTQVV